MLKRLLLCLCLSTALGTGAALAVEPDEMLSDPALEARARAISQDLRCPVCQGEDIDDSGAAVAHDLRILVRQRLVAGDTDQQVIDYIVHRYGEYVLFNPPKHGINLILYLAGPAVLLVAFGGVIFWIRRRSRGEAESRVAALDPGEEARLKELL